MTKNIFLKIGGAILGMALVVGNTAETNESENGVSVKWGESSPVVRDVLLSQQIPQVPPTLSESFVPQSEQQLLPQLLKSSFLLGAGVSLGYLTFKSWPYLMEPFHGLNQPSVSTTLFDDLFHDICLKKQYGDNRPELVSIMSQWCDRVLKACSCDWPSPNVGYNLFYLDRNDTSCVPEQLLADIHQPSQYDLSFIELFRLSGKFYGTAEAQLPSLDVFNKSLYEAFQLYCGENLSFLRTVISSQFKGTEFFMTTNRTTGIHYMEAAPFCLKEECVANEFSIAFPIKNPNPYEQSYLVLGEWMIVYFLLSLFLT